jgi:SNF2 family DNA or RNA helicase
LNLTRADYVFIFDPWWNPAAERQAIDRTHRIGQEQPVIAYRFACRGTVEEKVLALQAEKQELFTSIIDGAASTPDLDRDELLALLR